MELLKHTVFPSMSIVNKLFTKVYSDNFANFPGYKSFFHMVLFPQSIQQEINRRIDTKIKATTMKRHVFLNSYLTKLSYLQSLHLLSNYTLWNNSKNI